MKRNIFISPVSNYCFEPNFFEPVVEGIAIERILPFTDNPAIENYKNRGRVSLWGVKNNKLKHWENSQPNDVIFFYNSGNLIYYATIIGKEINFKLAQSIWGVYDAKIYRQPEAWPCIFYLDNVVPCNISFETIRKIANYAPNYFLRTFILLKDDAEQKLYNQYSSIEDFVEKNSIR